MSHLSAFFVANVLIVRFFCRKCRDYALFCRKCRDYALFGVEFWQKFWQKFLEILRILAEILRKKLACGASDLSSKSGLFRDYFWTMVPIGTKSGNWDFCASTALIYTGPFPPVLPGAISLWINHSKAPILMWHVSVRKESPLRGVALIHVVWSSLFCLVNSWMGDRLNIFYCHSRTTVMPR